MRLERGCRRLEFFKHANNPKHTAAIARESREEKVKTMTWPSMSSEVDPTAERGKWTIKSKEELEQTAAVKNHL